MVIMCLSKIKAGQKNPAAGAVDIMQTRFSSKPSAGQHHHSLRRNTFLAPEEAELLGCRCLDAHTIKRNGESLGGLRAHRLAMRRNLRLLAQECNVGVHHLEAALACQLRSVLQEDERV